MIRIILLIKKARKLLIFIRLCLARRVLACLVIWFVVLFWVLVLGIMGCWYKVLVLVLSFCFVICEAVARSLLALLVLLLWPQLNGLLPPFFGGSKRFILSQSCLVQVGRLGILGHSPVMALISALHSMRQCFLCYLCPILPRFVGRGFG